MDTELQSHCAPCYRVLTKDQTKEIHRATLEVLETFGVQILNDDGIQLLIDAGCQLKKTTSYKFPARWWKNASKRLSPVSSYAIEKVNRPCI